MTSRFDGSNRIAGLDGLRGIAVLLVLGYHFWPAWFPAGFLGVSLFFALSGYLVTVGAVAHLTPSTRFPVRRFWERRLRRLGPLAAITLAAVLVVWKLTHWAGTGLDREVRWAGLQAANWREVIDGNRYGASQEPSPVAHFWSLAVEEQFYFVFPIVVFLARTRGALLKIAMAGFLLCVAYVWHVGGAVSATYFSTFSRVAEILAGVVLAIVWRPRSRGRSVILDVTSLACVGALVALALVTSLESQVYYRGGLVAVGLLSAICVGAVASSRVAAHRLDNTLLVWMGRRSYGLYLLHWPVLIAATRLASGWWVSLAVLAATLLMAEVAYRYVEAPVRERRVMVRSVHLVGAVVAGMAVVLASTMAFPGAGPAVNFDRAATLFQQRQPRLPDTRVTESLSVADPVALTATPTDVVESIPRVGFFGDSKAVVLSLGVAAVMPPRFVLGGSRAGLGCALGRAGSRRQSNSQGEGQPVDVVHCDWTGKLAAAVRAGGGLDVAFMDFGTWDLAQHHVPALGDRWFTIRDARYQAWLASEMRVAQTELFSAGARHVAWATLLGGNSLVTLDEARLFNGLLRQVASEDSRVSVIDLAGWYSLQPDLKRLLPDGIHTTFEPNGGTSAEVFRRWLAAQLVAAASGRV